MFHEPYGFVGNSSATGPPEIVNAPSPIIRRDLSQTSLYGDIYVPGLVLGWTLSPADARERHPILPTGQTFGV